MKFSMSTGSKVIARTDRQRHTTKQFYVYISVKSPLTRARFSNHLLCPIVHGADVDTFRELKVQLNYINVYMVSSVKDKSFPSITI